MGILAGVAFLGMVCVKGSVDIVHQEWLEQKETD